VLAYIQLKKFSDALTDADNAIHLSPAVARGYQRKGQALQGLGRSKDAVEVFEKALKLDPSNAQIQSGLKEATESAKKGEFASEQQKRQQDYMKDIQEIFTNPIVLLQSIPDLADMALDKDLIKKLESIQRDFSKFNEYFPNDQKVVQFVSVALQYQKIMKMSSEEREKLARDQQERQEIMMRKEEEERDRKKREEKLRKEEEAKKAKEENESRLTADQREALKLKDEANTFYNSKKFPEALKLYDQAIEKDPNNIVFFNNKAACYMAMKDYENVIKVSEEGLTVGRENRATFDKIGLALQRIGNAFLQLDNLEESIKYLKQAQINDRNSKTLELLKQAESALENKKKKNISTRNLVLNQRKKEMNFLKLKNTQKLFNVIRRQLTEIQIIM